MAIRYVGIFEYVKHWWDQIRDNYLPATYVKKTDFNNARLSQFDNDAGFIAQAPSAVELVLNPNSNTNLTTLECTCIQYGKLVVVNLKFQSTASGSDVLVASQLPTIAGDTNKGSVWVTSDGSILGNFYQSNGNLYVSNSAAMSTTGIGQLVYFVN